jgi:hypothetical protein
MTKPRTCLLKLSAPALLPLLAFACATQPRPQPQPILSFAAPAAAATSFTTPGGRSISIETTNDFDTDEPVSASLLAGDPDLFQGTDRRSAKLSLVSEPVKEFGSVADLIAALPLDTVMMNRHPPISRSPRSRRVTEERRRVAVRAELRAAAKEGDNDFHLILCDEPSGDLVCFNVEVSGLPASGSNRPALATARAMFSALLGGVVPGSKYHKYNPAIPVRVKGSLFYDISHTPGEVGPQGLRPSTAWEIHPIATLEEM